MSAPARPGALVIGTNLRALAVARSLGRRGIEVWLVRGADDDPVARASRYVSRTLVLSRNRPDADADALLALAWRHRLRRWTLFPTTDESAALIAQGYNRLAATYTLTCPRWEILREAHYKHLSHRAAERAGVAHPWTRHPRTLAEVAALECRFPVLLKPDVKVRENSFTADKAWPIEDRTALLEAWQRASELVGPDAVMVQELIPGAGETQYSYAALCDEGMPLASLVARRTRQYPRDFGHSSSLVETVDAPSVEEAGCSLIAATRWSGLVELEFKLDRRENRLKLLDINGRVWTWHGIGARAGIDFPYLAWRLAHGKAVSPVRAQAGVRWVRLSTDIPSALAALRARELSPRAWWNSLRGPRVGALSSLDDPLPTLLDPALSVRRLVQRRLNGASGDARAVPRALSITAESSHGERSLGDRLSA